MCRALGGLHCTESISYISKSLWEQAASLFITAKAAYNRYGIRFLPLSSLLICYLKLQLHRGGPEMAEVSGTHSVPCPGSRSPGAASGMRVPEDELHPGEPITFYLPLSILFTVAAFIAVPR